MFVLNKEMLKHFEPFCKPLAVWFEKILLGTHYQGDLKDPSALKSNQIVVPKLIFDEKSQQRIGKRNEFSCICRRIVRKIDHPVGIRVVFSHLIARGRVERKQYLEVRLLSFEAFDKHTPLFKLAKRSTMKPNHLVVGLYRREDIKSLAFALTHCRNLVRKQRRHTQYRPINRNKQVINRVHE